MPESPLLDQLAELNRAIEALPVPAGSEEKDLEILEALKHSLDDARLALWARLQGVHSDDAPGYVKSFRVKRAVEICSRLATDLRLGLLDSRAGEYTALLTVTLDLANTIHTGRVRRGESAG